MKTIEVEVYVECDDCDYFLANYSENYTGEKEDENIKHYSN
ncbi:MULTISPECIES: hypothetical protein [unclassified Granulicatella]|nr:MULTISPECIES: hypothetical protein [unclassified Granulicatella]